MQLSGRQFELLDKLVTSSKSQTLLHGPVGTAKTTTGVLWLLTVSQASWGVQYGLLGQTEQQALGGPVNELMKLGRGVKRINNRTYSLPSAVGRPNRLLVFTARQAGDHQRIKSYNLAGGYVDELTEMPKDAYAAFIGRMRVGSNPRVVCTTNPKGSAHWVHRMFIDEKTREDVCEHLPTVHSDNPSLPEGYVTNLKASHTGHELERMVHGKWVNVTGAAFPYCMRNITDDEPQFDEIVRLDIGIDVGWSSITHAISLATDVDGVVWVIGEWVHDHRKHGELNSYQKASRAIAALHDTRIPLGMVTIDRSATEVVDAAIALLGAAGQVHHAYDRYDGVQICEDWAWHGSLKICRRYAPVLATEIRSVVWDEDKARLGIDELDKTIPRHGSDAMRYAVATRHIVEQGGVKAWENKRNRNYAVY